MNNAVLEAGNEQSAAILDEDNHDLPDESNQDLEEIKVTSEIDIPDDVDESPTIKQLVGESLTIDQHIDRINQITKQKNRSFFELGAAMKAAKDDLVDCQRCSQKLFLKQIKDHTGYGKSTVYRHIRAHKAFKNLEKLCAHVGTLPQDEASIRHLATNALNEDPELQAEIWTDVVKQAADERITAAMVKKAVEEKVGKPGNSDSNEKSEGTAASQPTDEAQEDDRQSLLAKIERLKTVLAETEAELAESKENERRLKDQLAARERIVHRPKSSKASGRKPSSSQIWSRINTSEPISSRIPSWLGGTNPISN